MQRTTVMLLFGGESSEHDVSLSSAHNVYAAMDNTKYDVKLCYIDRHGKWWLLDRWTDQIDQHGGVQISAVPGTKSFIAIADSRLIYPQVILPILHGRNGEDGSVQGLAQLLHIPIVGCDITASALCMDKFRAKEVLQSAGVSVVPWVLVDKDDDLEARHSEIVETLGDVVFVKPTRAGSSVGVSKVGDPSTLIPAIREALRHSDEVLVEKAISGRELEVAVLGSGKNIRASDVGEIIPGDEFYTYDDKYSADSASQVKLQAELPEDTRAHIRTIAEKAYRLLGCSGLARVDFFLSDDGTIYVNELNTLPGFTNISMFPKLWHEQGLRYPQLIDELITDALQRGTL